MTVYAAINAAITLWEQTHFDDPEEIVVAVDVARELADYSYLFTEEQRRQLRLMALEGIAAEGWQIHGIPMQIDGRLRPGAVVCR